MHWKYALEVNSSELEQTHGGHDFYRSFYCVCFCVIAMDVVAAVQAQRVEGWGAVEFGLPQYQAPVGTAPNSLEAWILGMNRTLR